MKIRNYLAVFLAVAALAVAPTAASAGGGNSGGGGGDNKSGCKANGPGDDCSTSVISDVNVVNLNGDAFNIKVDADRALSDNEITLIEGGVSIQINAPVCTSTSGSFSGEQCTVDVSNLVETIVLEDLVDVYLNSVTVKLTTILGSVFEHKNGCGCPSKK